jgi:hypothetical protein
VSDLNRQPSSGLMDRIRQLFEAGNKIVMMDTGLKGRGLAIGPDVGISGNNEAEIILGQDGEHINQAVGDAALKVGAAFPRSRPDESITQEQAIYMIRFKCSSHTAS